MIEAALEMMGITRLVLATFALGAGFQAGWWRMVTNPPRLYWIPGVAIIVLWLVEWGMGWDE